MILIDYRDYSIYCLYDRKINSIFISCSININENSMLKKITATEVSEIKFFTVKFINFSADSFIKFIDFFTDFFSQNDESIIENVTLSVRAKNKKKMSSCKAHYWSFVRDTEQHEENS